jgi:hypothetical protein
MDAERKYYTAEEENKKLPAKREERAELVLGGAPVGGVVPRNIEELWRLATIVSKSNMAPKGLQRLEDLAVGIMLALEVGLNPITGIQNVAVINGRASIWGDGALAVIRSSGLLEKFKEWTEGEPYTDGWTFHCVVKRRGQEDEAHGEFSWLDAKKAGFDQAAPESPWSRFPKRMMQWAARRWVLRDTFPDVLKGVPLAEDAMDIVELTPGENGHYGIQEKTEARKQELKEQLSKLGGKQESPPDAPGAHVPEPDPSEKEIVDPGGDLAPSQPEFDVEELRSGFINVRSGDTLKEFVMAHQDQIPYWPRELYDTLVEKWSRFRGKGKLNEPFPLYHIGETPAPAEVPPEPEQKEEPAPEPPASAFGGGEEPPPPEEEPELSFEERVDRFDQQARDWMQASEFSEGERLEFSRWLDKKREENGYQELEDLKAFVIESDAFGKMTIAFEKHLAQ